MQAVRNSAPLAFCSKPHLTRLSPQNSSGGLLIGRHKGYHAHKFSQHVTRRYASTLVEIATDTRNFGSRLKNLFVGTTIAASLVFGYYYITDTRAGVHQWVVVPALRWIYDDAEDAHKAGTKALRALYELGLHPRERGDLKGKGGLEVRVFGHTLSNPIGTSAGIDKHAEIPDPLLALGPAIVEVGGATPYPQNGNPKPRVWRLPSQNAFINRYGLNSEGAEDMAMRLRKRVREYAFANGFGIDEVAEQRVLDGEACVPPGSLVEGKFMAVQVAKNNFTPDNDIEAIKNDYVYCVNALARYADIVVVNVSSPNTPGLRDLQRAKPLTDILTAVVDAVRRTDRKVKPAVMVKVSPDEDSNEQITGICDAVWKSGVDGVIVGNTTKRRPAPIPAGYSLSSKEAAIILEQGGYSGPQLFDRTVSLVKRYRKSLDDGIHQQNSTSPLSYSLQKDSSQLLSESSANNQTKDKNNNRVPERIEATTQRDLKNLKDSTQAADDDSKSQPLFHLPDKNCSSSPQTDSHSPAISSSSHIDQLPAIQEHSTTPPSQAPPQGSPLASPFSSSPTPAAKVIFATGGITNGKQALEVLQAGASVAMVYTALVYGGAGTISRIKDEMVEERKAQK